MSGHVRTSSTVVTSSVTSVQPRFQVVFPDKDDRDEEDEQVSQAYEQRSSSRVTSEQYTSSSSNYEASTGFYAPPTVVKCHEKQPQQQQTSQYYVNMPSPEDNVRPESVQHYVIPPSPKEYVRPGSSQHYVMPPSPKEYVRPGSSQHYVIPPEPREYNQQDAQYNGTPPERGSPSVNRQSGAMPPRNTLVNPILPTPDLNGGGVDGQPAKDGPAAAAVVPDDRWSNVDLQKDKPDSPGYDGSLKEKGIQEIILSKDEKGKLGVRTKSIKKGIYVMDVVRGSPSAKAGLLPGDRILQVNGIKVDNFDEEKMHDIFKKMPVKGIRMIINKRPLEKTIILQKDKNGRIGLTLRSTKIHIVAKGSPADIVGLSTDNYIIEVNGKVVRGMREDEIRKLMETGGDSINITVMPYFLYEPLMKQIPIR